MSRVTIHHHADRTSMAFCRDKDEVDIIVTVTFDRACIANLSESEIAAKAVQVLEAWRA